VKGQLQLPLYVKPQITFSTTSGKVTVMVGPKNTQGKAVEEVVITIPFPKGTSSANLTANFGQVEYNDMTKVCRWVIGKLPTSKTPQLDGSVTFPPGSTQPDSNPVLQAEFKLQMFAASGIKVDTLALHNEKYKPFKGVRSFTKAGKFHVRS